MAVVQIHNDKYILKQSTRRVICSFQRSLWKFGPEKRYHGLCKHAVGRGRSFLPLAVPGIPISQEKPLSSPVATVVLTWAFSSVAKASVQTSHSTQSCRELR